MYKFSILVCASDGGKVYEYMGYVKMYCSHITRKVKKILIFFELYPTVLIVAVKLFGKDRRKEVRSQQILHWIYLDLDPRV